MATALVQVSLSGPTATHVDRGVEAPEAAVSVTSTNWAYPPNGPVAYAVPVPVVPTEASRAGTGWDEVGERPIVAAVLIVDMVNAGQLAGTGGELCLQLLDLAAIPKLSGPRAYNIRCAAGRAGACCPAMTARSQNKAENRAS